MNPSRRNLILIAAACGLSVGFAARRLQHPPASTPTAGASGTAKSSLNAARRSQARNPPGSPLAAELKQHLTVSPGVTRWLLWMAALEKAHLSDLPHLARMAKDNSVILRIIAARWMEKNPAELFDALLAAENAKPHDPSFPSDQLADQLFEAWSDRDPAAVVAALSRPDIPSSFLQMRPNTVDRIMQKDPELGLKALADWHIENYGTRTDGITKWAEKDPRHAAEYALAHPAGYGTQLALEAIGKVWAGADPAAALTFSSGLRDKFGGTLATAIAREWAAKDLTKAAAWLTSAEPAVRNRLNSPVLEAWAKTDTAGAMQWIEDRLSGSSQDEAVGAVLSGAAARDTAGAAALVSGMEPSSARARAAVSVAEKWFPEYSSNKPVPPGTIEWISSLDPESIKHVVQEIQWRWSNNDPKSLSAFLASPAGAHAPDYAFGNTARNLARNDPQAALKWAAEVPPARRTEALESVLREWQTSQPTAALAWARQLPQSDARREAFYNAALRDYLSATAAGPVAKALVSGNAAAARAALEQQPITPEAKTKLLDRLQLK